MGDVAKRLLDGVLTIRLLSSATIVRRTQRAKQLPSYKAAKSSRPLTSFVNYSAGLWMRRSSLHVTEPKMRPTGDRLRNFGNTSL